MKTKTYTLDTPYMHYHVIDRAGAIDHDSPSYYLVDITDRTNNEEFTYYYTFDEADMALRRATKALERKIEHDLTEPEPFSVLLVLVIGDYRRTIIDTM